MTVTLGKAAPAFSLADQTGAVHKLSDNKGKWVLLYFYPKDDTPGCTVEACSFRDAYADFKKKGVQVLGVSTDTVKKHQKFAEKFSLPFPLLADEEKKVVEAYGVWAKKKFMGREYMGTLRQSCLIDPAGKVAKIYDAVKPAEHVMEVMKDLAELGVA